MVPDAGSGFEYKRRRKRPREQEDEYFLEVMSGVVPPDT